jgi:hypothetical protein
LEESAKEAFYREGLKLPRPYLAKLFRWAAFGDWWDAYALVKVPTLVACPTFGLECTHERREGRETSTDGFLHFAKYISLPRLEVNHGKPAAYFPGTEIAIGGKG